MKNLYALSNEEDPNLMPGLTAGTSDQMPPPPTAPMPAAMPPTAPPPQAPMAQAPVAPTPKLPGMPASVTPADITGYLNKQRSSLDAYGPEKQMELQNSIEGRRNSLGYKLTDAGKGFADALMMGVAGAGNPNWQGQFQNQENLEAREKMDALKGANESNIKRTEAQMSLDKMNPNSELSKSAQETYTPLFTKLGYDPSSIKTMSAANIENALALMTQFGGKEVEAEIKQAELEAERLRLAVAMGKQQSDEDIAKQKMKADAATELLKGSKNSRFLGIPIPLTRDVSGKEADAAKDVLMEQIGRGTTAQTEAPAFIKTAINPKTGERMGTRDGKNWEPIQ